MRVEVLPAAERNCGRPRAFGEARKSHETVVAMNDFMRLDARSFHSHLGDLLRVEVGALAAFLRALAEFDRRKLFRQLGHASLFDYLHKGLSLSRSAAHHRRAAAWLVQRFPEVLEPIEQGRLCFTTASILASVMTEENRTEVLPRFFGLSKQEALEVAAELKPREVVPERTVVTHAGPLRDVVHARAAPVPVEPAAMPDASGRDAETLPPWTSTGQKVRLGELGTARTTVEPLTATASRLHITVSREFLSLLKKARAGESHRNPGATDEQILKLALEALIEKQSKRTASVPAKVKREVVKRDEGKCQWKLADGSVCGATARLEIDHVVPRGKGGPSTVENCRVLCKGHNIEAARREYGDEAMDLFTKRTGAALARERVAPYGPATPSGMNRPPSRVMDPSPGEGTCHGSVPTCERPTSRPSRCGCDAGTSCAWAPPVRWEPSGERCRSRPAPRTTAPPARSSPRPARPTWPAARRPRRGSR